MEILHAKGPQMAYRSRTASRRRTSGYGRTRSPARRPARRAPARRSSARRPVRRTGGGQTIRLVIQSAPIQGIADPGTGLTVPKNAGRSKF